ncbi:hypothetical protein [Crenobacter intestini]|uniref:Uncharacterized protein n=1 Tax=Crenobacter intestini TaxID=2563443 RepID=A0A4T0UIZ6_9NEIS|nr:hypothetical protein [Crenobacter intestini]TIC78517.1 hypothetical protein E5K04_15780 [Crenobacter intestini]
MKSLFAAEERESKLSKLGDPVESLGNAAKLSNSVNGSITCTHGVGEASFDPACVASHAGQVGDG